MDNNIKMIRLIILFVLATLVCTVECNVHAIKLNNTIDTRLFALEHNLKHIDSINGYLIFETTSRTHSNLDFSGDLDVIFHEKQVKRKRYTRSLPLFNDPSYATQWHLNRIDFEYAYKNKITGKGIKISVVDDAVEINHPDIKNNFNLADSWDFNTNHGHNTAPSMRDSNHGTAVYGVIAAIPNNNVATVGVSPGARVGAIKLIESAVYGYIEGKGLDYHSDTIDIYSSSWGNMDSGTDLNAMDQITASVVKKNYNNGVIYLFAGGNGKANGDNGNYDGFNSNIHIFNIGAINYLNKQSWYSENNACLFAVTYSSGANRGITTTDRTGSDGYSSGLVTNSFGGTSSATPLAAGIIALVLEKFPQYKRCPRCILHHVAKYSRKVDTGSSGDWSHPNARGYSHSHKYGFGLMHIKDLLVGKPTAIRPVTMVSSGKITGRTSIGSKLVKKIKINKHVDFIEQVELKLSYYAHKRGDIEIILEKNGVKSVMQEKHGDGHRALTTWTYTSLRHFGQTQQIGDEWTLTIKDHNHFSYSDQLRSVEIIIHGM